MKSVRDLAIARLAAAKLPLAHSHAKRQPVRIAAVSAQVTAVPRLGTQAAGG
jgi:hypothetical protein